MLKETGFSKCYLRACPHKDIVAPDQERLDGRTASLRSMARLNVSDVRKQLRPV